MEISLIRDVVIIVSGIVVTVVAIVVAGTAVSLHRKADPILRSAKRTALRVEALAIIADDELMRPMMQAARMIQGMASAVGEIGKLFKKGG